MKKTSFEANSHFVINGLKQDLLLLQDRMTMEQVTSQKAWKLAWQVKECLEDLDCELACDSMDIAQ